MSKELKALEIIEEKSVNVFYLKNTNSAEEYNIGLDLAKAWRLTQEEYDLLKKVLTNITKHASIFRLRERQNLELLFYWWLATE